MMLTVSEFQSRYSDSFYSFAQLCGHFFSPYLVIQGAAWLGSDLRVRCDSDSSALAVRQARVRISDRHPRGGPPLSGTNEEIKSGARRV